MDTNLEIKLYNTMTSQKEIFKPIKENEVKIYVCGITVYDYCHIGHARSSIAFDLIHRVFKDKGYNTIFVKNYTDIDDKIINRSNEQKIPFTELTAKFIKEHDTDMNSLFILPPTHTPHATDYIQGLIDYCTQLIASQHAYEVDGDVYFRVTSFEEYGKLSHRNIDDLLSGARVDINEKKENPLDFVLWKASKENEPFWESPFGNGRPGWHIECSVMNKEVLGDTIDIHGGGQDLIFPHHENEIAQSEACNSKTFANYWVHNGFVNVNKEKMSKSLNNFFTIRDVLTLTDPETLRFLFLTTHYRQPLEYSEDKLVESKSALDRIYIYLDELNYTTGSGKGKDFSEDINNLYTTLTTSFDEALTDDFNSPRALASLFEFIREGNKIISSKPSTDSMSLLKDITVKVVERANTLLGILNYTAEERFKVNLKIDEKEIDKLIEERNIAKKDKNYTLADEIRNKLSEQGVELIDTAVGTRYRA